MFNCVERENKAASSGEQRENIHRYTYLLERGEISFDLISTVQRRQFHFFSKSFLGFSFLLQAFVAQDVIGGGGSVHEGLEGEGRREKTEGAEEHIPDEQMGQQITDNSSSSSRSSESQQLQDRDQQQQQQKAGATNAVLLNGESSEESLDPIF